MKIFNSFREFLLFMTVLGCVFALNLFLIYSDYNKFKEDSGFLKATVVNSYLKTNSNNKSYRVLLLECDQFKFYTTTYKKTKFSPHQKVLIKPNRVKVGFIDYLKGSFYMPNLAIKKLDLGRDSSIRDEGIKSIKSLHKDEKIASLYSALYLAAPMQKELRADITKWGIAHLIAISGYHIGIIFAILFFLLKFCYLPLQKRYFPYRSREFDLSVLIFGFLVWYLFLLDFAPSYLRSLIMSLLLFFFAIRNIKIISFGTLFLTIIIAIALFPSLIFSVGFYFSCMGVLYIYLYISYFWGKFNKFVDVILLNLYIFFAMNIPVYYFFSSLSFTQIAVVPLGFVFLLFYPLSVALHLVGAGDLLDSFLLDFLNFKVQKFVVVIPFYLFIISNLVSILAIRWKFFAITACAIGFTPLFFVKLVT